MSSQQSPEWIADYMRTQIIQPLTTIRENMTINENGVLILKLWWNIIYSLPEDLQNTFKEHPKRILETIDSFEKIAGANYGQQTATRENYYRTRIRPLTRELWSSIYPAMIQRGLFDIPDRRGVDLKTLRTTAQREV